MLQTEILERRRLPHRKQAAYWVDPAEFCRLAVSHLPLSRCDDRDAGLRGLVNDDTGEKFLVEIAKLDRHQATEN